MQFQRGPPATVTGIPAVNSATGFFREGGAREGAGSQETDPGRVQFFRGEELYRAVLQPFPPRVLPLASANFNLSRVALGLGLVCVLSSPAQAEVVLTDSGADSTADNPLVAPVFEVRAQRPSPAWIEALDPGFRTVLQIPSNQALLEAVDLLARAPGVWLPRSGGLGSDSRLMVRGSGSTSIPVYLDGIPLSRPDLGDHNLARLPLAGIMRMEVHRGSASLLEGEASLGGALHLQSGSKLPRQTFSLAGGSFGQRGISTALAANVGKFEGELRAGWRQAENDWLHFDDNGTIYNAADDTWRIRENNNHRSGEIYLALRRRDPTSLWQLQGLARGNKDGLPGLAHLQALSAQSQSKEAHLRLSWRHERRDLRLRNFQVWVRSSRDQFLDPLGELGLGRSNREDDLFSFGVGLSGTHAAGAEKNWSAEFRREELRGRDHLQEGGDFSDRSRQSLQVAVAPRWRPHPDLLVESSLRGKFLQEEYGDGLSTEVSPTVQLGLRWRLRQGLLLKGSLGSYRREPTLLERFGQRQGILGDTDLRAEYGINRDLGLVWIGPSGGRVEFVFFDNDARDLIHFRPINPATSRAQNVGRAAFQGLEIALTTPRMGPFRLDIAGTHLDSRDRSEDAIARGHRLAGRPQQTLHARLSAIHGPWILEFSTEARDELYLQSGNRARLAPRALLGTRLEYFAGAWTLALAGENLTDRHHADRWGYPRPGRSIRLSCSWQSLGPGALR